MHRRGFLGAVGATGLSLSGPIPVAGGARPGAARDYAPVGRLGLPGAAECVVSGDGTTAFVAVGSGFATVDLSDPADPTVLARVDGIAADREDGPLASILDVDDDGDRLLVSGPAQIGKLKGLVVYDVSDPSDPVPATEFYDTGFDIHNSALADGYAYLTNNRPLWPALTVVDVARETPREVGRWAPDSYDPPGDVGWNDLPGLPWPLHDVTVHGGYAYCSYWDAGTWILDVSDPADPAYVSRVGEYDVEELVEMANQSGGGDLADQFTAAPGNDHHAAVDETGRLLAVGGEAWEAPNYEDGGGPAGIRLYDVSTKADPGLLARIDPPSVEDASRAGTWVTAHNADLTGGRLYSSWYQAGVKVHDVSDPSNPELLAWWREPDETAFWTAQYATEEFFVATSYEHGEGFDAALYAFPNEPGRQADPPPELPGDGGTTTGTTTETTGGTTDERTGRTGTTDPTTTSPTTGQTTAQETPGLGVGAALAGVGAGLAALYRRRRKE